MGGASRPKPACPHALRASVPGYPRHMCGICGWVDWRGAAEVAVVRRMAGRLAERGPDGEGVWRDPSGIAVLGHRRLKVLDLSDRAEQPMQDPGGDVLVYNG